MDPSLFDVDSATRLFLLQKHKQNGVRFPNATGVILTETVRIGEGAVILPGCILCGETTIGANCIIGPNSMLCDTTVGGHTALNNVHSEGAVVGGHCEIGPWVRLRPGTVLGDGLRVGNFVEIKNSRLGDKTSVAHLSYIGDATIGERVNVGCGLAVANYDGQKKHRAVVENDAFIGCHNVLVSPVRVGAGAYTAAGSVITEDVPEEGLAIARARQVNKEDKKARYRRS